MQPTNSSDVIFGGTFDPIHEGHVSVIRFLQPRFSRIVIAPTSQNPWKDAPGASFEQRLEMIRLVLTAEGLSFSELLPESGIWLCDEPYVYAKDFVAFCRNRLSGDLHWAVGEDSADTVSTWKDWDSLGVELVVAPVTIDVHGEKIRAGRATTHPAIAEYARRAQLYSA